MTMPQRPPVVDCFLYNGEATLLDIRLKYLDAHVDRFIIAESAQTFSGRSRIPTLRDDIRKIIAELPSIESKIRYAFSETLTGDTAWQRETELRNTLVSHLADLPDDAVILLSDVDEIPNADSIPRQIDGFRVLQQELCYYRFNLSCVETKWLGTRIFPVKFLRQGGSMQEARRKDGELVVNAGWHFSYVGSTDAIVDKLQSFSHTEYDHDLYKDHRYLEYSIATGHDLFGRKYIYSQQDINLFPPTLKEQILRYPHLICEQKREPLFHENWYSDEQATNLRKTLRNVIGVPGAIVEIGSWEGKSTCILANESLPGSVIAVDWWKGNINESATHPSVLLADARDVFKDFTRNVTALTQGNVLPIIMTSKQFFEKFNLPIRLCHIDACHDYNSVKQDVAAAMKLLEPGGMLCGDDFQTANRTREDLNGGVQRAVEELLPGVKNIGNFWYWRKPTSTSHTLRLLARRILSNLTSYKNRYNSNMPTRESVLCCFTGAPVGTSH